MKNRQAQGALSSLLAQFPAVVLLGPRQCGKTTLAFAEQAARSNAIYLDLELPSAQRQLDDPEGFFLAHPNQLVILDEVQRMPGLFAVLRGVIDQRRRAGEASGQFLLLGSASGVLLQQSSESLAGRVATLELTPFQAREVVDAQASATTLNDLWVRGGFPLAWLAADDSASLAWRDAFIATYLEKDIPALGPRIPSTTLRRLMPWSGSSSKRLVRAPKVYVRDSGLVHALLGLPHLDAVLGHPVAGGSWEGFVLEQLIAAAPQAQASYYRTSHGAEVDLVLEFRNGATWVIEIKRSSAPSVSKGFYLASADLGAARKLVVAPVPQPYPLRDGVEVMPPLAAVALLAAQ